MALVKAVTERDFISIRQAIAKLSSLKLGPASSPTYDGLTLTGLTASRLISTDDDKTLSSVGDLTSWIAGTDGEIDVADDGDGTVTVGIVNPLIVSKGGSGAATFTDHSILLGSETDAFTALGAATNGQLPIGSTGNDPVLATLIAGTGITISNGVGSITVSASSSGTHNELTGIQGGTTDENYHLTVDEYSLIHNGWTGTFYNNDDLPVYVENGLIVGSLATGSPIGLLLTLTYSP